MRVVLTGGGTGGHIYPALSVARCLESDEVLYVGTATGPEAAIVPCAGLSFHAVPSRKLSRRLSPESAAAAAVCAWGVLRAAGLLLRWRPAVVLGTGGYASAAVMFAATLLRVPTVIHEANAVPGRVNRILGRLCTRVAVTFEATARFFPAGKTVHTGMPVRPELLGADPERARAEYGLDPRMPTLLVSGGSGGARSLNQAIVAALPRLGEMGVQVVHQTGAAMLSEVIGAAGEIPPWYHPLGFVEDLPALMAASTLVVCRAGSSTLAEVAVLGLPAVIVPYPYAVADHQTQNARALSDGGAGVVVPDAELSGERLVSEVAALLKDPGRLESMRVASRRLARPDAARRVADLLLEVAGRRLDAEPARSGGRGEPDRPGTAPIQARRDGDGAGPGSRPSGLAARR